MQETTTRTTLTLPSQLLEAVDQVVREGKAKSRNQFVTTALRRELAALKRAAIDADFARMKDDQEYQEEALRICKEFATSDWEAFQLGEQQL
ncbi:MAG: ribbon-helix-helix protein, CopG family [SAR202 cluster bacterium]|nr:ribbon-helix-helix protein, CopG family [SAR202 cluster bacterium]